MIKKFFKKTLCFVGIHSWRESKAMPEKVCRNCGRRHSYYWSWYEKKKEPRQISPAPSKIELSQQWSCMATEL